MTNAGEFATSPAPTEDLCIGWSQADAEAMKEVCAPRTIWGGKRGERRPTVVINAWVLFFLIV